MSGAAPLADLVTGEILAVFLVFARIGTAMMVLPMFGEPWLTVRGRLVMALVVSFALTPGSGVRVGGDVGIATLVGSILGEAVIGAFLGLIVKWVFAGLHLAGAVIAMHSGLQMASMFDPQEATQSTVPSAILTTTALTVLFATDAHHLLLAGLARSYDVLPFGALPDLGYMSDLMNQGADRATALGFKGAAPMVLVSFLMNVVAGIMNRMMPTFQVLFVLAPGQIMACLLVMGAAMATIGALAVRGVFDSWTQVLGLG